jgi:hypothetical protein
MDSGAFHLVSLIIEEIGEEFLDGDGEISGFRGRLKIEVEKREKIRLKWF